VKGSEEKGGGMGGKGGPQYSYVLIHQAAGSIKIDIGNKIRRLETILRPATEKVYI